MSYTTFGTNDDNTVKLWSKMVTAAEREYLEIKPLMGETPNSVIYVQTDLQEKRGDKVTFNLRKRLAQDGKSEGETAEGNGESLSFFVDSLYINELLGIVGNSGVDSIDQQRVQFDIREQGRDALGEWWAERTSVSFFNQVCGNTAQSDTKYTGLNSTVAPSSGRIIRPNSVSTDQGLSSTDPFTLDLIDQMVTTAKIGSNRIRPIKIGGKSKYIVYMHPAQVQDLRTNSASGQWAAIRQAAMQGGDVSENDIYTGALGEHNGCILRESQDVTLGVHSTAGTAVSNVRRAVLLGAQAAIASG